ncbi:MAG: hypothetical protein AB1758_35820, partial [Candidatus Eremiobacterota bacterium]
MTMLVLYALAPVLTFGYSWRAAGLLAAGCLALFSLPAVVVASIPFLLALAWVQETRRSVAVRAALDGGFPEDLEVAVFLNQEGFLARLSGRLDRAETLYRRALTLADRLECRELQGIVLANLARASRSPEGSAALLSRAAEALRDCPEYYRSVLEDQAALARSRGDQAEGDRLDALRSTIVDPRSPFEIEAEWREYYECDHWRIGTGPSDPRVQLARGLVVLD